MKVGGAAPGRMAKTLSSESTMEAHSNSCLWFAVHTVIIMQN